MSNIFDALQRSESEQPGSDSSRSARATELLRRAERRATTKWETAERSKKDVAVAFVESDMASEPLTEPLSSAVQQGRTTPITLPKIGIPGPLGQTQSIKVSPNPEDRIVSLTDSESPAAEAFRLLGIRLRDLRQQRPLKRVLITSTVPAEGKSMISANLACTLAVRMEQRTLLVEGDLRLPSIMPIFGLKGQAGLCECLRDGRAPAASIYHLQDSHLWIMPAGKTATNALDLLQAGTLPGLLDQLNEWFDWIIIDSPPVLPLADTSVWARLADGILLVTRQDVTEKRLLKRGIEALDSDKLIGALLNSSKHSGHGDYYYAYRSSKSPRRARKSH